MLKRFFQLRILWKNKNAKKIHKKSKACLNSKFSQHHIFVYCHVVLKASFSDEFFVFDQSRASSFCLRITSRTNQNLPKLSRYQASNVMRYLTYVYDHIVAFFSGKRHLTISFGKGSTENGEAAKNSVRNDSQDRVSL